MLFISYGPALSSEFILLLHNYVFVYINTVLCYVIQNPIIYYHSQLESLNYQQKVSTAFQITEIILYNVAFKQKQLWLTQYFHFIITNFTSRHVMKKWWHLPKFKLSSTWEDIVEGLDPPWPVLLITVVRAHIVHVHHFPGTPWKDMDIRITSERLDNWLSVESMARLSLKRNKEPSLWKRTSTIAI